MAGSSVVQHGEQQLEDRVVIDPGAPHTYDRDTPAEPAKPAEQAKPDPTAERLSKLEEELATTRRELAESQRNAQRWADRFAEQTTRRTPDPEPEPEPEPTPAAEGAADSGDVILDDINEKGLKALQARGVITIEQLRAELDRRDQALLQAYEQDREAQQFDANLYSEFPELKADDARVSRGEQPQTEIYKKTAQHFTRLCKDAQVAGDSPAARGLILAAARMAKAEIAAAEASRVNGQNDRRERIEAQGRTTGDGRGRAATEPGDRGPRPISAQEATIIGNLSRFGVNEESFQRFAEAGRNGGGRRG